MGEGETTLHVTLKGAVNVQVSSNTAIFYLKLMPYFNCDNAR